MMGPLAKLRGAATSRPGEVRQPLDLAFVLLSEPHLPDVGAVIEAHARFEPEGGAIELLRESGEPATSQEVLQIRTDQGESAFVALMPGPVPNGEADQATRYSVCSVGTGWTLSPHTAHLLVTSGPPASLSPLQRISRFTSLLGAVTQVSPAVGVYWGSAGATHSAEFFLSIASEPDVAPRIMLWTGLSIAREKDGRLSLLSLGMRQLGLPNLLLVVPPSGAEAALETFFDLLSYLADRGEAIPEGDTVGRTETERLRVRYVRSPADRNEKVWRVELP